MEKQKKLLRFTPQDNVAVTLEELARGDRTVMGGEEPGPTALYPIPQGHKIALQEIKKGQAVRKYGHVIGTAAEDIPCGGYVHNHNVQDEIADWDSGMHIPFTEGSAKPLDERFKLDEEPALYGYRRSNGQVGFRNYVLVLSTCVCANHPVKELGYTDREIVCIENPSGCIILPQEVERLNSLLLGLARNPNVGAVIFVGLGCENIDAEALYEQVRHEKPAAFFISQRDGSTMATTERLKKKAAQFKALLAGQTRQRAYIRDIRLGTKCGASDWTSAAASNPAIGYASDLVVKNGGVSLLGETCGWFGGEEHLIRCARDRQTADKIIDTMTQIYRRCKFFGKSIEQGNPTPGNFAGGISTLKEKALGNTMKGGTAPVEGMLDVGEQPAGQGLYVSDNAGIDPASLFSLTANSANILLYSTGRGSPVGSPLAPAIKLTASPTAMAAYPAHMDVDLTDLVLEGTPIAEGGWRLLEKIIEVANGTPCIAERERHCEYAFPLMMGPM